MYLFILIKLLLQQLVIIINRILKSQIKLKIRKVIQLLKLIMPVKKIQKLIIQLINMQKVKLEKNRVVKKLFIYYITKYKNNFLLT